MTIREMEQELDRLHDDYPNEYISFQIEVNRHRLAPASTEVCIYSNTTRHIYGASFKECVAKLRSALGPRVADTSEVVEF